MSQLSKQEREKRLRGNLTRRRNVAGARHHFIQPRHDGAGRKVLRLKILVPHPEHVSGLLANERIMVASEVCCHVVSVLPAASDERAPVTRELVEFKFVRWHRSDCRY